MAKIFFENGQIVRIYPEPDKSYYDSREMIYGETNIVSDGISYDLSNIDSIKSIQIPTYVLYNNNVHAQDLGVTGYLEYILRIDASIYWTKKEYDLSIACLAKATELMKYSTLGWLKKDYYRIVDKLKYLHCWEHAEKWEKWINYNIPDDIDNAIRHTIELCTILETDLVEVGDINGCCRKCAAYRKRIYSLTGNDRRFPIFPRDFHTTCGLIPSSFVWDVSEPSFECKNVIKYSNRRFKDDRTKEQLEAFQNILEMQAKKQESEISKSVYYDLMRIIPDDLPKSVSAFSRAKNAKTDKWYAIVKKAEEAGYTFPEMKIDLKELENEIENSISKINLPEAKIKRSVFSILKNLLLK